MCKSEIKTVSFQFWTLTQFSQTRSVGTADFVPPLLHFTLPLSCKCLCIYPFNFTYFAGVHTSRLKETFPQIFTFKGQVERGFGQPDLVGVVCAHGRAVGTGWSSRTLSGPNHSVIILRPKMRLYGLLGSKTTSAL